MSEPASRSANSRKVPALTKPTESSTSWKPGKDKIARFSAHSWRAPTTMLVALFLGLGLALAHHFVGASLNGKPIASVGIAQAWIFRFGTALAFLVKLALATSVGAAYTQHQWQRLREQSFRISEVDALTSVLANAFSFFSSKVWLKHPVLALMALISWGIPLAAVIAPGSFTVSPTSVNETVSLQVRQPDFNYTNFGTFTGGDSGLILGDTRIYSLAYRTASTEVSIGLESPGHYQNVSYHLDFHGPAVKCASANETYIQDLTYRYGIKPYTRDRTLFISWVPQGLLTGEPSDGSDETLDTYSRNGARIFVLTNEGTWNVTRTYNGSDTPTYQQVNVTECLLFNASYSVDYGFAYPNRTQKASITNWLNPVAIPARFSQQPRPWRDNVTHNQILSFGSVMDAFGQMIVGEAKRDRYDTQDVTSTIWKLVRIDWRDSQAVSQGLEALFQNITLSLLSDDALIKNGTSADFVPVTVNTWPVTYVYFASDLLLAYGIAFLCALSCSAVGLYAFYINKASYQNLFSTYLRATNDSDVRPQIEAGDDGADPLPRDLARSQVALSERREARELEAHGMMSDGDEVQPLSLVETDPSLGIEWNRPQNQQDDDAPGDDNVQAEDTGVRGYATTPSVATPRGSREALSQSLSSDDNTSPT